MEHIIDGKQCTGCSTCVNICPKKAITMKINKEGFEYPCIDQKKCINCGLCKKTCPVISKIKNDSINECYVAYAKNSDIKKDASSGGIFPLIANYVLDNNGIVIGASFDNNNVLRHIEISKKEDLYKLKGSKYIQSKIGDIFKIVKENVEKKLVLFVGTPCQVAGLKAFIKNDNNLICIDFVCHGVPSPKLFDKYVKELEANSNDKLMNYKFRDKSTGWDTYSNVAQFKNKTITELSKNNKYMGLFLSDISLRESCYNCNFKLGNKYSDITLGDFWGVKKYYPEMYSKDGVSAIIINNDTGKKIFEIISKDLEYKKCKLDEIVSGNKSLQVSSKKPQKRSEFFNEIDEKTIDYLYNKYKRKRSISKKIINKIKSVMKSM